MAESCYSSLSPTTFKEEAQQHSPRPAPFEAVEVPEANRKRSLDTEDSTLQDLDDRIVKRIRVASRDDSISARDLTIKHWSKTGYWSPQGLNLRPAMDSPNQKRPSSSMSYTQSVKEGLTPPAYSPAYEEVLREAGIYMDEEVEQTISHPSQVLCQVLLDSFFPPPTSSLFAGRSFLLTLDEARHENEARVQRDITPLLVPCASLLYLHDRILPCRHLSANIQSEWTRVKPLAGPLPVPDYVVGLKRATFTHNEILALHYYSAPNKSAMFRDGLYFPFLVCEVKRGENGLSIAERQSMHVASVAMNAIVELFKDRAVSQVKELDGEILVFSISHDHETVRIYGHYPRIQGDQIHLHRHLIRGFLLRDQDGKEKWTTYHLVRKMYDHFAPIHLNRIRGAIAKLPVPSGWEPASGDLDSNPGESEPQEMAEDSLSSAGTSPAKKPRLKPTAILQGEVDWLKKEREEMKKLNMKEREDHKQEIERLRQDFKEQMDQLVQLLPRR